MAKILVVEDERVAAQSIQAFLRSSGHTVVAYATSGSQALRLAATVQPDLVLMDIFLEGELDGIAAAQHIREQLGIPVVYLTAGTDSETWQRALATGPLGYLIKPFDQTGLSSVIAIALHRHQVEKNLLQAEQWLTTTLTSIGDGTITVDAEGRITFMNPVAQVLTGWSASEALGLSIEQVLHLVDSRTGVAMENPLLQAIQMGQCISTSQDRLLRAKDGTERLISETAAPIRNEQGLILGGVLIFQDMTEHHREEQLLHRREQEFRALVENSPDIVARFDRNFRYLYVNPAIERITSYPASAIIGKTHADIGLPNTFVRQWQTLLQRCFEIGEEQTVEFEFPTTEGTRSYQSRIVPEWAADGSIDTVLSVTRDITELKHAAAVLRQQAEREQLLDAIAQRIRQSLDLNEILNTAVTEIRQILHADRVVLYEMHADGSGTVIVESVGSAWIPMLGHRLHDPCLMLEQCITPYLQGHVSTISDLHNSGLAECYINLLAQFQVQANLVVPILQTDQLWGLLVAQQCESPRQWQSWEIEFLRALSSRLSIAIQQSQLYQQTQHQAQREQALNRVLQAIRSSLDLEMVFSTSVNEIGRLLQIDRAEIFEYWPLREVWINVASYRQRPDLPDALGMEVPDTENDLAAQLKQQVVIRLDSSRSTLPPSMQHFTGRCPGAWLLVPLTVNNQIWGALSLMHDDPTWVWRDPEVELARTVGDQLAIAIHQSKLYSQVQQLNAELETLVLERTAQLQRSLSFEALLKRITDKVRDSLDENQILQTAVDEVGQGLGLACCSAGLYDRHQATQTVAYEYTVGLPSAIGQQLSLADKPDPEIEMQLLRGQDSQFCYLVHNPVRPSSQQFAILACPIVDDQGVLGSLWLYRPAQFMFSQLELRLVQQVANQCAIATRQSRLYQAAESQVNELERLNQLKDNFLSSISHELRTPMTSIKMAIQMLEVVLTPLGVLDPNTGPAHRYFQILHNECQIEIDLINNLLELSRLDAETTPLICSSIHLASWLEHASHAIRSQIQEQQQCLVIDVAATMPDLVTDRRCLEQIMAELLTNACKYTPAGETIIVFAQHTLHTIEVGVRNTGVTIPATELPRIFERFYRIPQHDPWRHRGIGLGLALVQKLVEHVGASIHVSSDRDVTTFTVIFPRTGTQASSI